jgi:uncharacterized RDD family membrane protein YckC
MTIQDNASSPHMAQCSITGKMVPEDELVTIQGQRVCAEGKAILLERLQSGETLPGELRKPTVIRRFGCIFLDGLIIVLPLAILAGLLAGRLASPFVSGAVSVFTVIVEIVYFGQMHGSGGQTIGKKAGKLMVVNLDGSKISMQTAYVRAIAYVGPGVLSGLATISGNVLLASVAAMIVGLYGLANMLAAVFDTKEQRALHDRIAGTRVIDQS